MEIEKNTTLAEAAGAFQSLPAAGQDAIIVLIKSLLSKREQCSAPLPSVENKDL